MLQIKSDLLLESHGLSWTFIAAILVVTCSFECLFNWWQGFSNFHEGWIIPLAPMAAPGYPDQDWILKFQMAFLDISLAMPSFSNTLFLSCPSESAMCFLAFFFFKLKHSWFTIIRFRWNIMLRVHPDGNVLFSVRWGGLSPALGSLAPHHLHQH